MKSNILRDLEIEDFYDRPHILYLDTKLLEKK